MTAHVNTKHGLLCVVAGLAAFVLSLPAWADESATEKTPPQSSSSLDDQLLQQLDDDLEGKAPAKHLHKHEHDSHTEDATNRAAKPSPRKSANPAPAKDSTDEDLLKQLDAEDEPGIGPSKSQPGDDLGEAADPLTRIGTKMRQAVSLIDREKLSPETTALQDEIVKDIDELIKQQKKKMQQQQQQSSSSQQQQQQQQQSSRSNVKPQGQQAQQQRPQNQGGGEQESKQAAQESEDDARKSEQKTVKLDPAAQDELLKRVWGILPEKDREQMRQAAGDQFLPEYESLIIRYFRRLAEEENR